MYLTPSLLVILLVITTSSIPVVVVVVWSSLRLLWCLLRERWYEIMLSWTTFSHHKYEYGQPYDLNGWTCDKWFTLEITLARETTLLYSIPIPRHTRDTSFILRIRDMPKPYAVTTYVADCDLRLYHGPQKNSWKYYFSIEFIIKCLNHDFCLGIRHTWKPINCTAKTTPRNQC